MKGKKEKKRKRKRSLVTVLEYRFFVTRG